MAKIEYRLSKKILTELGRSEIVINFSHQHLNMRAKSGIYVNPSFFEYYIEWKKTESNAKKYGINSSSYDNAIKQLKEAGFIKLEENIGRLETNAFRFIYDWHFKPP